MIRRHKGIIFVLLAAFILRFVVVLLAIQFREHPDILRWKDWGRIAFLYGFADTYQPTHLTFGTYPNNMPPGTLYIVSAMYWVWLQAGKVLALFGIPPGSNAWVNIVLLQIILRIPSLIADMVTGLFIYLFVHRYGKQETSSAIIASSLFLFSPVVLFNSAFWGQMDAINNMFALIALWLLLQKKYVATFVFFALSLFVKFSLLFALPFILFLTWWKSKKKMHMLIFSSLAALCTILVCVLPISRTPFSWLWYFITHNATGEMTNITAFAFNFWWVIFHPSLMFGPSNDITKVVDVWLYHSPLTQTMIGPISLGMVAILCSLLMYMPAYRCIWIQKTSLVQKIFIGFGTLSIISFLFLPQMHERYLYPAFIPLAILIGFGVPVFWEFVILSLVNFVNLLIVWHPMPLPIWMFDGMRNVSFQWSIALLTTLTGLWTVWKLLVRKTI